jgi:stalled ribosome alternative rescue factor ArfA
MEKFDKRMLKMNPEELQAYLAFKRKGSKVPAEKGKGSYNRKDFKKEVA